MSEQLSSLLNQLAEKLGTTVEMLWTVSLRHVIIGGWANILMALLFFVLTGITGFIVVKYKTNKKWTDFLGDGIIIVILLGVCFFITAIISFGSGFMGLLNPQYYAFQSLMGAIK